MPFLAIKRHLRADWAVAIVLGIFAIALAMLALRSQGLDLRAFHVAAKAARAHLDPYADNRLHGDEFADVANENAISRWIYPPPALFFAEPLGLFSFKVAKLLFEFLSGASLVWTLLYFRHRFKIAPVWLALACISLPVVACVQRGQVDLLILLCVVLAFCFSGRFWAGIPLGVAISIKIFPAALLLWWLLERKFKEAATAIAFTLGISLLAAWRFGLSSYASFLHNLTTLHSHSSSGLPSVAQANSLFGHFAWQHLAGPWLSFSPGFVGSYNNPLILFDDAGIFVGFILTLAAAFLLHFRRVAPELGFFSMVLASQLMNTALWTMGMVMYIPLCLIAIGRFRSRPAALLLLIPLYLPSQVRVIGITPRFLIALLLVAWVAFSKSDSGAPRTIACPHEGTDAAKPKTHFEPASLTSTTNREY